MSEAYERFRALHEGPGAFVMPNPWDGASAVLLKRAGFPALASTSLGIAFSLGCPDGVAAVSRAEAIDNAKMIARLTGLPVNGDLEDGFGPSPEDCAETVEAAVAAGLAGAGVDVLSEEPPAGGNPLLDPGVPNLLVTPHVAWAGRRAQQALADRLIRNIEEFFLKSTGE